MYPNSEVKRPHTKFKCGTGCSFSELPLRVLSHPDTTGLPDNFAYPQTMENSIKKF